ncbi:hypothetical protein QTL95_17695 [Rhizobium sp. S152]|uniref:hypothetical protein n=1 Tax=Rhizobium sp. S152 TaxID=3055038 RepID=UPI0025A983E1|nr:hypothetical protein [Rhizobium sp. S152]MDM9627732.1 hypothetical protein [Rhizobium sp. S152]
MPSDKRRRTGTQPALPEGVEDHGSFQRRFWIAQRVAWIAFALILGACLLGLLGRGGVFSSKTVGFSGGSIELPAISRWNAPDEMRVSLSASDEDRAVFVDARFFEVFSIDGVDPPQKATTRKGGRIGYIFGADPTASVTVVFRLQTQQPGRQRFFIGIDDDVIEQSTLILP